MSRLTVFCVAILALSWLAMMALHELGHVFGAVVTGGTVQRVVLHPLTISRTDIAPNPHPALVVWMGPVVGSILPLIMLLLLPARQLKLRTLAVFFAGFCLIANGAYIGVGSFTGAGDSGEMLRTGTPQWAMWLFGAVAIAMGLYLWHRLGSPRSLLRRPDAVTPRMVQFACGALAIIVLLELGFSPR